ncbi:hypothetical protein EWM64_g431 [Hericium alpestre]|uniref:Sphingolipid long chain base-responsive protein LSP1 n=1 Tax=Hericium alpestre TaxID=135208 RepID=A0A4Z0AB65_9AGAM|nr:hypothetical protein EWM64_g431 [Hericium alpestre]
MPSFLSSIADKAQNALQQSPLASHLPPSFAGRPTSPPAGDGSSGQGYKSHTIEQLQHQFRTFQQQYSTTSPVQKIITTEKGVALDYDSLNRDLQALSKELYTWGQDEAPDVKDITDRLAFLHFISGALANTLATKLNAARTPLKALRTNETALSARRNQRAQLDTQIGRLEHQQEKGYEKRIVELREQLAKAKRDDEPDEKEHEILKRKALKESEQLQFEAFREYAEKLSLVSQASQAILNVLPLVPPSNAEPYNGVEQTGTIRATLQHALDNWQPGHAVLSAPADLILNRENTGSFGETHAKELASISSPAIPQSNVPITPPGSQPGRASPQNTDTGKIATSVPAPAPIPIPRANSSSTVASRPKAASPVPSGVGSSPTINTASLNNAPAPIPATSAPSAVSRNPMQPEEKVPSVTPTVAETGVPVSAGANGPGPISGSLRDIPGSRMSTNAMPPSVAGGPPAPAAGGFESAEDEKRRLERERILQGSSSTAGASASVSPASTYVSAEEEKKRLEREERERLLHADSQTASGAPPHEHDEGETPPPYQDF